MRAVIQRVDSATLSVNGQLVSNIGKGLVVYFGVECGDSLDKCQYFANKIANMRIFPDDNGKMNYSCLSLGYEILLVSQFTLLADTSRGNRPSYTRAEQPTRAQELYLECGRILHSLGIEVQYGVFGQDMTINQVNCGPVTIVL